MKKGKDMMLPVKKTGKGLKILVVILCILVLGLIGYILIDKGLVNITFGNKVVKDNNINTDTKINDTDVIEQDKDFIFEDIGGDSGSVGYGKAQLKGYIQIEHVSAEQPSYEEVDLVWFNILKSNDTDFNNYLNSFDNSNYFIKKDAISIGCLDNNKIIYSNDSDDKGLQSFEITGEDAKLILDSKEENPITLNIEKLKLTSGRGVDTKCYSHLTYINVVK